MVTAVQYPQQQDVDTAATPWQDVIITQAKHVSSGMMLDIFHEIILAFVLHRKAS